MGSSNKHWPSLFRSRPSSSQSDSNSPSRRSASFPSVLADGSEERTPEPKPRWNPKPEQIRILEAIFNSGMVNPPRDEISKIRAQLQEYGQVGDANVFYWFQNRKSRSKAKNRQQNSAARSAAARRAPSSSSSSSDRSSNGVRSGGFLELSNNSSTGSVNQNYSFPHHQNDQYLNQLQLQAPPPYSFPGGVFGGGQAPGVRFNEIMGGGGAGAGGSSSQMESFSRMLLGDQMMTADNTAAIGGAPRRSVLEDEVQQRLTFMNTNPPPPSFQFPSTSQVQGVGGASMAGPPKSTVTVFINEMPFEVPAVGPFNVQETFGEDVVLLNQSGHPVPTNNWGATVHPLTHGASYHLARLPPAAAAPNHLPFNYKM